ncbi:PAS domain-containing protein [Maridesulfovibrio salexigens]|uniref:histidine kinase n=1 Tax=Maridesulfovibrio salexigens (strain ATCC 14822 / DSM 2638 / NCIMB 8403 / VKM B-1763) TaxID=526222 RepID=C6C1M2_MARSD|nr:transporter substrate-binding domain-containing protein [Maridesulfovibrio salexigens]ACS81197.1 PAS/PAC sensor signal transduction histidine kinase [Maridesulfovibrio salexigens DSM 2638]
MDGINPEIIKQKIKLSEAEMAWLKQDKTVTVRVGDWPPFMMTENQISGISIDYLDLIASIHGIKFNYATQNDISWPEALKSIRSHDGIDMVPAIQQTDARKDFMSFSIPYQTLPWVIVTRDDAEFVGGLDDLASKTVSVQDKFILQKQIEKQYPNLKLRVIKSRTPTLDSLKDVATKESYATINALPVVVYFVKNYGLSNLKVAAPAKFDDLKLSMGIRNDWPELASIISKTIQAMSHKDVAAIHNSWLSVNYEPSISTTEAKRYALLGLLALCFVSGLFVTINRTLKKKIAQRTKALIAELDERERIQRDLKVSEERYDMALRAVSDGLWDWNLQTNEVYYSPRYFEMLGYEPEDFPNEYETWLYLMHPDDRERASEVVTAYLSKFPCDDRKSLFSQEFRLLTKEGEWKWILSRGRVPEFDDQGNPVRLIGTHMDITDRKRTEQLMIQTEKMMSIGGLAAGMAHEINNPLAGILGHSQNIRNRLFNSTKANIRAAEKHGIDLQQIQDYMTDREIPRMIDGIRTAGNRAAKIVSNMLSFSRQSEKEYSLHNIKNILEKAIELSASDYNLEKLYDFRQIKIIREYDPEIPPIYCEGTEIQQVLMNLLKNGAEAMRDKDYDQESPQFICRVSKTPQEVVVEIEDNGPGIDYTTRSRIFEPFYTTKDVGKGTGLGLSVSYFIITSHHNGSMTVDSSPGNWTRFTIRIPFE